MAKRLGLGRLEKMVEELNRDIDLEGSDVTVNTLTADLGVTATAGGLTVSAGQTKLMGGDQPLIRYSRGWAGLADDAAALTDATFEIGMASCTPTVSRSKATPSAADIMTAMGLTATEQSADFSVANLAAVGSGLTVTITAGANVTLLGTYVIQPGTCSRYRVKHTGGANLNIYQVG
jgi:hypothetical protein